MAMKVMGKRRRGFSMKSWLYWFFFSSHFYFILLRMCFMERPFLLVCCDVTFTVADRVFAGCLSVTAV